MSQKKLGIIFSYGTMAINLAVGIFFSPFMLQMLGDSQYGVYSLSASLISFIAMLDLGLGQTLVRYISKARATGNTEQEAELNGFFIKIYSLISLVALAVGGIVVFAYPVFTKKTMSLEEIELFKRSFLILLINTAFSFPMCVFSSTINAYERFFFQNAARLVSTVVKYACMVLALLNGYKLIAITLISAIASILLNCVYLIYCKEKLKICFSFKVIKKDFAKEIFLFSFIIFLNIIVDFLYGSTDKLILGAVSGTAAVTVYTFGVHFSSYFVELSTAMSGVFLPSIVNLYETKRDMQGISNIFLKVGRLQMAVLSLVLGGFVLLGNEFITLWIGESYRDAYYIGLIIMLPAIIPLSQNIGISVLRAMNIHKYRSYMYLAIAVINVLISIPLAQRFEGIGAAIGTCLANLAGQILFMSWFYSKRVGLDIRTYYKNLSAFLLLTAPLVVIGFWAKRYLIIIGWSDFFAYVFVFSAVYAVGYWAFIANPYEKKLLRDLLHKVL